MTVFNDLKKDFTDRLKTEEELNLDNQLKLNAMNDLKEIKSLLKQRNIKTITNLKKLEITVTIENKDHSIFANALIDSFLDKHQVIFTKLKVK